MHSSHTSVVHTNLNLITIMQSGVKYANKSHTSTLMLDRRSFQTVASLNLSAPVNKRKRVAQKNPVAVKLEVQCFYAERFALFICKQCTAFLFVVGNSVTLFESSVLMSSMQH